MVEPPGAPELQMRMASGRGMSMGRTGGMMQGMSKGSMMMRDQVAYSAHCINGAAYPRTAPIPVRVGQRVRLRILNANPTETRYIRLAGHTLRITHSDGNPMTRPVEVQALRVGVAERYDVEVEITRPGAWLLQGLTGDGLGHEQAVMLYTEGREHATPERAADTLEHVHYFLYQDVGVVSEAQAPPMGALQVRRQLVLSGGMMGKYWRINGHTWPHTPKIGVHYGDHVLVRFLNHSDMDHPMHLHGHVFELLEVNGQWLRHPLSKDTALVPAMGGSSTWRFSANSPPGRWLLHCHNSVHMEDGMMMEVDYLSRA